MMYHCCDERRRLAVEGHPTLNGIDYVEVLDTETPPGAPRQRTLLVRFVKPAPALVAANFEITGGERVSGVDVLAAFRADAAPVPPPLLDVAAHLAALPRPEEVYALRTSSSGDHSTYTLHLVASSASLAPPPGIDPLLAHVGFSFKVECPSDFDCAPAHDCASAAGETPRINYLAKDYRSFRRLMLDRLAETLPDWRERNAADLGVALVEVLAYVGDRLSYAQDAVAAEAYLGTARRRVSVRRHARLVDHRMHDGSNARVLVQVRVAPGPPVVLDPATTTFLTRVGEAPAIVPPPGADPLFSRLMLQRPTVFEPMHGHTLHPALNDLAFHDWGEGECCIPKGATRATLVGDLEVLAPGDILVFEETISPRTGRAADADPGKRWAVRLVQVAPGLVDPVTMPPRPITEIRWAEEDALPFALCLSARTAAEFGGEVVGPVSRAIGNIVVADHGLTVVDVPLGAVPEPHLHVVAPAGDRCVRAERVAVPPRFRPAVAEAPLTEAEPLAAMPTPASAVLWQDLRTVTPQISAREAGAPAGADRWEARRDLLASEPSDRHFAVEVEADGTARLRFGDGRHGRRPPAGTGFLATYRIGSGPAGNVGAEAIFHVVTGDGGIEGVRNPMPARGGRAAETMAAARVAAPQAFRVQERAVTPEDYAAIALRHPAVQRAAATFRWNGHGHTVFVTVDRFGGRPVTAAFEAELVAFLEPYRMAGYDLEIDEPRYVPIELEMLVCCRRDHFRAQVKRAVLDVLGDGLLPAGRPGLFHPDALSFGQDVHLSRVVAAVQAVEGVESVTVTLFRRQGQPDPVPLESGVLAIGRLEIARLANDPNFPERGRIRIETGGGK